MAHPMMWGTSFSVKIRESVIFIFRGADGNTKLHGICTCMCIRHCSHTVCTPITVALPHFTTTPGGRVVEHLPGVWKVVGSIPGRVIPKL